MRYVMLGGPGSGKGTQAEKLSKTLRIPVISTGGILREAIASETSLGLKAQRYVEKGELIPDQIMIQFMRQRLLKSDVVRGWVLEGYPRTSFQAEELDFLLEDLGQKLEWAIYLKINELAMMERSLARSLFDDHLEAVQRRIENFYKRTVPILEYYQGTKRLLEFNAERSPDDIKNSILDHLRGLGQLP